MPDFILVGAGFSGADTVLKWLGEHPQIFSSPVRETNYFANGELRTEGVLDTALLSRPQARDGTFEVADTARITTRRDYRRCFQSHEKPAAIRSGEASPSYLYYPHAARQIAEELPYCKIIVVLREPVERTLAHYASFEASGREHLSLASALEQEERRIAEGCSFQWAYSGLSQYRAGLKRYLARFPLPQIHLVQAERLADPAPRQEVWRGLLDFLQVDATPAPLIAGGGSLLPLPTPEQAPSSTRRALGARLQLESSFYQEAFSEAPFKKSALRRLTGGNAGESSFAAQTAEEGRVFQHLLFTSDLGREPLYYRKLSHGPSAHPRISGAGMHFLKDECISFDGFFNAFFESLVAERTGMRTIQLRLEFSGRFFVEVLRLAQGRTPQLVASHESERRLGDGPLVIELDLTTDSPLGSRFAFHLTCLSKEARLGGGSWNATAAPRRHVQLDILACTYKKTEFIERTVRRVADYGRLNRDDYHITVVDNASELSDDFFSYPNVRIVRQGNTGGAGGAARGIIEGLNAEGRKPPTHFLLMDDDIELEPDMVLRAMSWLRYLVADHCVGGGMLDLYRPTHLHELGCWLARPKLLNVTACVSELELAPPGMLDRLGRLPQPHFNAWWFVTISRAAVEKNGLPLPCFIRGDDKEFGYRMLQNGVPTLPVPGIGVWHLPFYAKISAWLYYYNMYNDMLIQSLRYPKVTGEALAREVWREIEHYLRKLEYDQAAMRVIGLEHFLRGPEWLLQKDCEERFRETMAVAQQYAAEHRKDVEPESFDAHYQPKSRLEKNWRRWTHNGHLPLKWRKPVVTTSGAPRKVVRIDQWGWTDVTYFDEIGVKHPLIQGILVFRKKPDTYFDLRRRTLAALALIRAEWPERSAAFRAHEKEFTSEKFWRQHLRMAAKDESDQDPEESALAEEPAEPELVA